MDEGGGGRGSKDCTGRRCVRRLLLVVPYQPGPLNILKGGVTLGGGGKCSATKSAVPAKNVRIRSGRTDHRTKAEGSLRSKFVWTPRVTSPSILGSYQPRVGVGLVSLSCFVSREVFDIVYITTLV